MHKLPPSFCRQKIVQWAVAGQRQMDLIAFTSKDLAKPYTYNVTYYTSENLSNRYVTYLDCHHLSPPRIELKVSHCMQTKENRQLQTQKLMAHLDSWTAEI